MPARTTHHGSHSRGVVTVASPIDGPPSDVAAAQASLARSRFGSPGFTASPSAASGIVRIRGSTASRKQFAAAKPTTIASNTPNPAPRGTNWNARKTSAAAAIGNSTE